jgi:uncharacterized protein YchJ
MLSFLTHCAGPQVVGEEEKAKFRDRINEYWQYRIKGDAERAYQCEVPAFREKVSILQYANRFKLVKYLNIEVQEIEVKGREASSKLKLTYVIFLKAISDKKLSKLEEEKWVKVKGTWYHVPEDFEMKKNDLKG